MYILLRVFVGERERHSGLLGNSVCVFKTFVGWIKRTFRTTTRRRHSVLTTGEKNETFPQTEAETRLNWTHQSHFHFRCECFYRFFFWSSRLYSSRFTFWMFFCAAGLISHQHAQIWSVKTASWPESLTEGDETEGAESLCTEYFPLSGHQDTAGLLHLRAKLNTRFTNHNQKHLFSHRFTAETSLCLISSQNISLW